MEGKCEKIKCTSETCGMPIPDIPEEPYDFKKSNYYKHAVKEFTAAGYDLNQTEEDPNKWIVENIMELLEVFAKQGHSGSSAPFAIKYFTKLAHFEPLVPLTGKDDEWMEVGTNVWQNIRCSHVFKDSKDGVAYDIDGKVFIDPDGTSWTNFKSRVPVTFPYVPKTKYVHRKEKKNVGNKV
jgi:hypothetical protein